MTEDDIILLNLVHRLLKPFNKKLMRQDFRKLGINVITASIVGGLITHATRMTFVGSVLISIIGIAGCVFVLFGLHKVAN